MVRGENTMTKSEKLKQLDYEWSERKNCRFKLEECSFVKIIDLTCCDYGLDVGIIHHQYEVDNIKHLYEEVKDDFHKVMECEDDD